MPFQAAPLKVLSDIFFQPMTRKPQTLLFPVSDAYCIFLHLSGYEQSSSANITKDIDSVYIICYNWY